MDPCSGHGRVLRWSGTVLRLPGTSCRRVFGVQRQDPYAGPGEHAPPREPMERPRGHRTIRVMAAVGRRHSLDLAAEDVEEIGPDAAAQARRTPGRGDRAGPGPWADVSPVPAGAGVGHRARLRLFRRCGVSTGPARAGVRGRVVRRVPLPRADCPATGCSPGHGRVPGRPRPESRPVLPTGSTGLQARARHRVEGTGSASCRAPLRGGDGPGRHSTGAIRQWCICRYARWAVRLFFNWTLLVRESSRPFSLLCGAGGPIRMISRACPCSRRCRVCCGWKPST